MITLFDEVKTKLENFPNFRERRFRGQYLAKLALRSTGLENRFEEKATLSLSEMSEFAIKYDSYRHAWGDVTRECKELRGTDYDEGEKLSQEKQLEMGYTPDYKGQINKLNTLL